MRRPEGLTETVLLHLSNLSRFHIFGDSVFSDRHARPELGIQSRRTLSPSLPPSAVRRLGLTAPKNVSQQYW
jgi:hypothetical protein